MTTKPTSHIRNRDSYLGATDEARARQLSNLKGVSIAQTKTERAAASNWEQIEAELQGVDILTFASAYVGLEPYPAQAVLLKCIYGLPLNDNDMALYPQLAGGLTSQHGVDSEAVEAIIACGARGGKSKIITSLCALYESIVKAPLWRSKLQSGEVGYCTIIATRREQAQAIIQANCANLLQNSPKLSGYLIEEPLKAQIELANGMSIISLPCNSTAARGLPIFCAIFDEIAHFYVEGVRAADTIYDSLIPRLAQFPGAKTIFPSTPSAKQGLFWDFFREGFDVPGRVTFQASTRLLNPTIPQEFLDRMKRRNPDNYAREFDAQFAERVSGFFNPDTLNACFMLVDDIEPSLEYQYSCGIDQSGLSGEDMFGLAIMHQDRNGNLLTDAVRSWAATKLDDVIPEIRAIAQKYHCDIVLHDRYAAGWVSSTLTQAGLRCDIRPQLPIVYNNFKALVTAGKVRLIDNAELRNGLFNTVAYYGRNNALSIAHERGAGGHADMADAVVTAAWGASEHGAESEESRILTVNYDTRNILPDDLLT